MPFDGTDFQDMSLEEKALRHADVFFSGPEKWWRGANTRGPDGSRCIGQAIINGSRKGWLDQSWGWADRVCGKDSVANWNETCPSFAEMKAHLRTRIKYYEDKRLKVPA